MSSRRGEDRPRRGLVLGGGGVLGGAWAVGALTAIEEHTGLDLRAVDHVVGTSAGSVLAALLGAGISPGQLRDHQRGLPIAEGPLAGFPWDYDRATGRSRPSLPRPGMGSAGMVARNVTRLRRMPPTAVLSALLPQGRGSLARVAHLVEAVSPAGEWSAHPGTWVVAMDYESGRRVPFGRPGEPEASLAEAVMASCAIPAWYMPVSIGGRRYVDGGACSATSADLLAGLDLDEVYVVAPMVSFELDHPRTLLTLLERRWRHQVTRRCLHEVAKLRAEGTKVTILGPGAEDLEAMGHNVMDVARRVHVLETSLRTTAAALQAADQRATDVDEGDESARSADAGLADAG